MKLKYIDLIEQTFDFPQEEFKIEENRLLFHNIPLMDMVRKFGTPLKFTYLPKISTNIQQCRSWFHKAMKDVGYNGSYTYCYCTKSNHYFPVIQEALKNNIDLETSSAYDLNLINKLYLKGLISKDMEIVCNGFKTEEYLDNITLLLKKGFSKLTTIIDNDYEIEHLLEHVETDKPINVGIRIAAEEEPKFEFYTSRLGIGYKDILPLYREQIRNNKHLQLKMLHFFINTGIRDTAYYWNELFKCLNIYAQLKKICPELDSLNIGGGFPIKNSLAFDYDYEYMVHEIVLRIKEFCQENEVPEPNIYTEFGSFTVGESGGIIYKILDQKKQNDREKWNMIDSSFMTTLPDAWALNKRFVMLPLNRWNDEYERVLLGGLTCDSDDYYNSEQHVNAIYLPKYSDYKPLYIGFFNTNAYQDSLSGVGGLNHCLIPNPKQIIIDYNSEGKLHYQLFREEQTADQMLHLLGY